MPLLRDPVAIHNERVKLFAHFVNAIGLGLIGFAILRPLTENLSNAAFSSVLWGIVGLAMHGLSHYVMGRLRKED